jgi:hypothetical protein
MAEWCFEMMEFSPTHGPFRDDEQADLDPETIDTDASALALNLEQAVPLLMSPDSGEPLCIGSDRMTLADRTHTYPLLEGLPVLFPARCQPYLGDRMLEIPFASYSDAFLQYFLISSIKQSHDEVNSPLPSVAYRRHLYRSRLLLENATGTILDIGTDDPSVSRKLLPATCRYLGLEPMFGDRSQFRLIGVAEFLPIRDESCDGVCFLTSLDHVMDYQRAIREALRILKPGGWLYLASLVWEDSADLFHDHVHFHHFRHYELEGALSDMTIESVNCYRYKEDTHRYGIYLRARKADIRRMDVREAVI